MPYSIVTDHPECSGYAVIKDAGRELMGCHKTQEQAERQLTALNIAEYGDRQAAQMGGTGSKEPSINQDESRVAKALTILTQLRKMV